ncbi:MAG: hypothetical protein WAS49_02120 [Candidatus Dechloromonas phosphoritropha]|nr:hypothetical protein [Candidatus Dechloromonas phosphoritropha]MBP8787465.1 hypothetical protein [Azonexus sp.]
MTNKRGCLSHHRLLTFVAEARMVANFWLLWESCWNPFLPLDEQGHVQLPE